MYVERIKYQVEENGEMLTGYYVGAGENCDNSTILDKNYKPYEGEIWNYYTDYENRIRLSLQEKEDFEEEEEYKFIAKVYVDDIEGWQDCKIIHSYRDRAVVVTRTGTQLNRILKMTEDYMEDGCVYLKVIGDII